MTKINCYALILLLRQWFELGQGALKEEWELSSLERVWLEIFWRVNSAVAEARVLRFLSFIHWAGRRGRSRSPFIISGTLSGECSLQQPSSAHRMINLQTIGKDRLVIHQPSLRFELSSYNVYPRQKNCLIEKEIHDAKLWNTFNDISCHCVALNNENHSFGFLATVKCALYSPTNYGIVFFYLTFAEDDDKNVLLWPKSFDFHSERSFLFYH